MQYVVGLTIKHRARMNCTHTRTGSSVETLLIDNNSMLTHTHLSRI